MTHAEAIEHCQQRNRNEQGERHWFVKQAGPDQWQVVSMTTPGLQPLGPLKATVEVRPEPDEPPDPRPSIIRNIPPFGPG
jgi:hypothetical protein